MRTIGYFSNRTIRGTIYIAHCSECGDFAERHNEDEMNALCVDHSFNHISRELQVL
jgi:hypothetical protein